MEFLAPIHLLSLVLLLAGIALAFSEIRLSGGVVAWILLSGALLVQGFRSVLSYLFEHGGVDPATYHVANDWMGLGFSLLIVASMYMMREVFAGHRQTEDKLRVVSAAAQDAIITMDNAGRIVYWNEAAQGIFGYSAQEAQGKKLPELIVAERYRTDFESVFGAFSSTGQGPFIGKTVELAGLRKDGTEIVAEHSISAANVDGKCHLICIARDITERKRAEAALHQSEARYRELFGGITNSVAVYTAWQDGEDFVFTDLNPAGERLEKITKQEVVGRRVAEVFPGVVEFGLLDVFRRVWKTGQPEHHPLSFYHDNRITGWRENYVYRLASGEVVAVYDDVTERKQGEEALVESEKRYRSLFENMFHGFAYCRMLFDGERPRDFIYLDVNIAFEKLTGLKNVVGKRVTEVIPGIRESHPELFEIYGRVTLTGQAERFELYFKPLESWLSIAVYGTGEGCFVAVFDNITERKQAEAALGESERKLRLIAENATDVIFAYDMDRRLIYVNPALKELTGYTVDELKERNFIDWAHPEDEAKIKALWEDLFAGKGFAGQEFRIVTKDGQIKWCSSSWGLLYDESGRQIGVQGRERDITERKRAEDELQTSHKQLRAFAARLTAAREEETILLAREIHDELGQALTGLKMDLSWFASRLGQDRRALKKKADSMLGIVDTTIDCVRNIATRLRPKMLDDLGLVAAIEWQAQEFRKHAGINCAVISSMSTTRLGQQQSIAVFRIVQEALTNIARHAAPTRVDINLHEEAGWLILEVRDNGRGIRVEEIAADKSIGLLGMRERAIAAGGKLALEGFPGRGTVVTLRVPLPAQ